MTAHLTDAIYALVLAGAIGLDLVRARRRSLTFWGLLRRLTAGRVARLIVFLGWVWLGWHLFVRGSVPRPG